MPPHSFTHYPQTLLAATKVASSGHNWLVRTDNGTLTLRPFAKHHERGPSFVSNSGRVTNNPAIRTIGSSSLVHEM